MRKALLILVAILFIGAVVGGFFVVRNAQRVAIRMRTAGRLSYLRSALENYESRQGSLPRRELRDKNENPAFSWLAAILPHVEGQELFDKLNFEERWDSPENLELIRSARDFWERCYRDGYFACPLKSDTSIWNPTTGMPRGTLNEFPHAVLLVGVPMEGVHPLEPYAISLDELRKLLEQQKTVIYIKCDGEHGYVVLDKGEISFQPSNLN